ncbi:hypothetical protein [Actinoplanes sp. TFC3]|nr:hypothetical protein [Actinoplanes sp. TFC3]
MTAQPACASASLAELLLPPVDLSLSVALGTAVRPISRLMEGAR